MSGKHLTSPKGKQPPTLKSFHEETSPKLKLIPNSSNNNNKSKLINAQSTESLESLSDEMTSSSTNRTHDTLPTRVRSRATVYNMVGL